MVIYTLKMQSYFSKFSFLFHQKNHHFKDVNSEIWLKQASPLDVWSKFVYRSYLYLTVQA